MRISLRGGTERESGTIAAALLRGGLALVDEADEPDLIVTLGGTSSIVRASGIALDPIARRVTLDGRALRLSPIELDLLGALLRAQAPLGRRALLEQIWGYRFDPGTNLVAVHIARLRAKIGRERIEWTPAGYRVAGIIPPPR